MLGAFRKTLTSILEFTNKILTRCTAPVRRASPENNEVYFLRTCDGAKVTLKSFPRGLTQNRAH